MKGETIVIPRSMCREMLDRIHVGHMGIAKSRQRARDIMYWPKMNSEIADMVSKCSTCLEHRNSNQKEPMIPSQIPTKPWEMVATDLFTLNGENYLLIVDYYSRYFEVAKLSDTKSATVIMHTKSVFARHGIAAEVRSDNGPQYSSHEYKDFAKSWGFVHVTTSPYFPQANGLVEKTVSTVKSLLKKAQEDGKDPYLGLLEYRNTPLDGIGSPAQMLMGRRLRSTIPMTSAQLQPGTINPTKVQAQLRKKQQVQKAYFDKGSKSLSALETGDTVRIQQGDRWHPATVVEKTKYPRSYVVETPDGGTYRRNRRHLMSTNEPALRHHIEDVSPPTAVPPPDIRSPTNTMTPTATESVRTSGREIRKPIRFKDYVT
ncbi:PREDICTED: uncharacterized protein K02A2.6-like [Priapulus caudatus]|uniref:RNA-directed DNA polymerase n=1 Tax=Priapulus caudatus TaxID=37621 RepID=A0ABM1EYA6_PRICU|nr:PREDICTED: uncharacterized protein K02A2.6-like [Priapulus caudatus]